MEQVKFVPLYCVAMPKSMIIITKAPFITTLAHTMLSMRYKPQTPRGTKLMNVHAEMPKEVNKVFTNQPLDPTRGELNPLDPPKPPRYFGLPMVNPRRPPLPPNKPYHRPLEYLEYVKDSDLNAHVRNF